MIGDHGGGLRCGEAHVSLGPGRPGEAGQVRAVGPTAQGLEQDHPGARQVYILVLLFLSSA